MVHGKSLMDSDDDALLKSQHINTMGQFWVRLAEILSRSSWRAEVRRGIPPQQIILSVFRFFIIAWQYLQ